MSLTTRLLQGDLAADRLRLGDNASPITMGLSSSFEPLNHELVVSGAPCLPICSVDVPANARDVSPLPCAFECRRVEERRVAEDRSLASSEFGQLVVLEVAQVACEVPVRLQAGVVPRGAGVGA